MKLNMKTKEGEFSIEMDVVEMSKSGEQLLGLLDFVVKNKYYIDSFIEKFRNYQVEDREYFSKACDFDRTEEDV